MHFSPDPAVQPVQREPNGVAAFELSARSRDGRLSHDVRRLVLDESLAARAAIELVRVRLRHGNGNGDGTRGGERAFLVEREPSSQRARESRRATCTCAPGDRLRRRRVVRCLVGALSALVFGGAPSAQQRGLEAQPPQPEDETGAAAAHAAAPRGRQSYAAEPAVARTGPRARAPRAGRPAHVHPAAVTCCSTHSTLWSYHSSTRGVVLYNESSSSL